jgi:Ku protein
LNAQLNTTIETGTLAIPVGIAKATQDQDVKLDRAGPQGGVIKRQEIEEGTGEVVTNGDFQHGRREGDDFHAIKAEDLETIKEETKLKTIPVLECVPLKDVDFARATGKYYVQVQSKGGGGRALKLFHDALRKKKAAAVVKFCLRDRQSLGVIYDNNGALVLNTIAWGPSLREPDDQVLAHTTAETKPAERKLAEQLIEVLTVPGGQALHEATDDLIEKKAKLVEDAVAGRPVKKSEKKAAAPPGPDKLLEALEAEVAKASKKKTLANA